MKVGDLVVYAEMCPGPKMGLVIGGPAQGLAGHLSWEIAWISLNKTGWWDEFRLEVISESR